MALQGSDGNSPPSPESKIILLVEDEDSVRKMIREMLRRHGFTVLEAAGADQALEICSKSANPIDVVLTDIAMPGMSGLELATRLEYLFPKTKLLFMSGYCDEGLWRSYSLFVSEMPLIQKPFTLESLMKKIREILEPAKPVSASVRAPRPSSGFRPLVDHPELGTRRPLSLARRIERLRSETWQAWENFSISQQEFNILQAKYGTTRYQFNLLRAQWAALQDRR